MTSEEILGRIAAIMQDVFDEDDLVVTAKTTATDVEDWDSLAQIQIIDAIEKDLGIKFTTHEIERLNKAGNVGDTVALVQQKQDA